MTRYECQMSRPRAAGPTPSFVNSIKQPPRRSEATWRREHTAQVPNEQREEREEQFRSGDLPIMYCSPTMELGVDIAQLNVVNLRNVPPTPANYAQRSGARRSKRTTGASLHLLLQAAARTISTFLDRPELMVAGEVAPPRLDLNNRDLLRAHIHAVWLAEVGLGLGKSLTELLEMDGESP